ncbi:transposase [Streptomyces mirabilis]|uniref:transposase n=1 Tax=Streptomyces mirabilis TaxID=68239 RepID=UPI00369C55B1
MHLRETCEPDAPHLITNVVTTNATVNDTEVTAAIHQHLAERELKPREHVMDAGYVTVAHILAAHEDHGIDLVGPVGIDTHHSGRDAQAPDLTQALSRRTGKPGKSSALRGRPVPAGPSSARPAGPRSSGSTSRSPTASPAH